MCNADFLGAGILKMALISMTPKRRGCLLLASYSQTDDNQPDPDLGEKWMVQIPGGVFYMNAKARLWASSPPRKEPLQQLSAEAERGSSAAASFSRLHHVVCVSHTYFTDQYSKTDAKKRFGN